MKRNNLFLSLASFTCLLAGCNNQPAPIITNEGEIIYQSTQWEWTPTSNGYTANAILNFSDGSTKTVPATVSEKVLVERTCDKNGTIRYTASLTYGGVTVSNHKDKIINSTGHNFTSYTADDLYHYSVCDCGAISNKADHEYGAEQTIEAPDGWKTPGRKYKECNICHYKHYENITDNETYRNLVITKTKETLDSFTMPETANANQVLNEKTIHELYSYLTKEEILSLDEPYLKKLLSVMFDFNKVVDNKYSSCFDYLSNDNSTIERGFENDDTYGRVSTIEIKKNVPNRTEYPNVNTYLLYGESKYNYFLLREIPDLKEKDKEMVIYVNAPYSTTIAFSASSNKVSKFIESNSARIGMNYITFDKSKNSNEESKGYVQLNQGWNAVVFDEDAINDLKSRDAFEIKMEVIDNDGLKPGKWAFSSLISRGKETYTLLKDIEMLPNEGEVEVYDGTIISNLYSSYLSFPKEIDELYNKKQTLLNLKREWDSFAALPYGIYPLVNEDSTLYATAKGSCYKYDIDQITYNKGMLHCNRSVGKTISSPFPLLGFYIKGYDGVLSVYSPTKAINLSIFDRIQLDDGWSFYVLSQEKVDLLKTYDLIAESWNCLFLRFNDPINPGTLYCSPLYSFKGDSKFYNSIVANIADNDDELHFTDKGNIDIAYSVLMNMNEKELSKCLKVDRIKTLHSNFPIKGVTAADVKKEISIEGETKNDWGHYNNKGVYYNFANLQAYTLVLPKVSYKYCSTFVYQGEFSQGFSFGLNGASVYKNEHADGVNEYFTITITSSGSETKETLKIYANATGDMNTRDCSTFSNLLFEDTKTITDQDILSGNKALTIYLKANYSWANKLCIASGSIIYK